jgi:hypothetical protein
MTDAYRQNFALIDWSQPILEPPRAERPEPKRAAFPCPRIVRDEMPPTQCMADGAIYDSKSRMSRVHRDHGMIEVGNEKLSPFQPKRPSRKVINETVERAIVRHQRGERV